MFGPATFTVMGALSGCMGCMVCVESLAKKAPSTMNLMTFMSFLFISLEGLIFTSRFFSISNKIPLRGYIPVVLTFFLCNVINNQALNFHVPVPLHIIFRSGSLLTSLILNRLILKRKYPISKQISVLAITIGIIICTLATANIEKKHDELDRTGAHHFQELLIGILMLTVALLLSSYLAISQEQMYAKYGSHHREAMFYIHAISLPFFAFVGRDILKSAIEVSSTPALHIGQWAPFGSISLIWVELIAISVMQFICILYVYKLGAQLDSLSVTLVVTLRKFLSLLVSIFWFQNTFTSLHWFGALLVFLGTLAFSNVFEALSLKIKSSSHNVKNKDQ